MLKLRDKQLEVLKRSRWKRSAILIAIAFACVVVGLIVSMLYFQSSDMEGAMWSLILFDICFPLIFISFAWLARGRDFAKYEQLVRDNDPIQVEIEDLDALSGELLLHLSTGTEVFKIADLTFGLFNAINCEWTLSEASSKDNRKQIERTLIGKQGSFYRAGDAERAVLIVDDRVLTLIAPGSARVGELQDLKHKFPKD